MAVVRWAMQPEGAQFLAASFPEFKRNYGTNGPVTWLAFDASATETAFWEVPLFNYGSGNLTLDVHWGAATATSGVVRWEVAVAAITPDTDTQDPETKAFATAQTVDATHAGTTAKRLMRATIAITNLDALAVLDLLWVKVSRLGGHANDTMAGDAWLNEAWLSYSDS